MSNLNVVGKSMPRKESLDKLTGRARYTNDYEAQGLLHARMVTSLYAHAKIKSVESFTSLSAFRFDNASDDELREVASYLKYKQNSINENTFSTLVGVDFRNKYIGRNCEHYFLIGACLYKLGIYKEAAAVFELVANELSGSEEKLYYRCISDYAAAIAENKPTKEIASILGLFYPENIAQKVCGQMEDPGRVMESFYPEITCFNCSECGAADNCSYAAARGIKRALKDRQVSAGLKDLRELGI